MKRAVPPGPPAQADGPMPAAADSADPAEAGPDRREFVLFQQRLARLAIAHDELGAACAALRVLRPEDFRDPRMALVLLWSIRDRASSAAEETAGVVRLLIRLAPAG